MVTLRAYRRLCAWCGRIGSTAQHAQNVRFWLVWQVARSSWQEQYLSAPPRSGDWAAVTGLVIDVMRKTTLGLIGSHVLSPVRCRSGLCPDPVAEFSDASVTG